MSIHEVSTEKFTPHFLLFYQILKEMCWKSPILRKKVKKRHFSPFFNFNLLHNHLRYEKNFFIGMKGMHWSTFKPNMGSRNLKTKKGPYILGNSCLFWPFLGIFYLIQPPGQHLGNTCWPKFWNTFLMP